MASESPFLERMHRLVDERTPLVALDGTGVRVRRVPEGVLVDVDPEAYRKGARKAGLVVGAAFALFGAVFAYFLPALGIGLLAFAGLVLVLGLRAKPREDRLLVAPHGIEAQRHRRPPKSLARERVRSVRLERHEVTSRDSEGRSQTRVFWHARAVLDEGEPWFLASGGDRAVARAFAEDASVALGVPFVDATGATETVVAPDHVNTPLVERLKARAVVPADAGEPPKGVERRQVADGVEFVARHRRWGALVGLAFGGLWFCLLGFGGAAVLVWIAFSDVEGATPWAALFALFPLLFGLVGLGMIVGGVAQVTGESFVRVGRSGLSYGTRRFGREKARPVALDAFEDVRAVRGVLLVSDEEEVHLGFGHLDGAGQAWMARAVLDAVARYAA